MNDTIKRDVLEELTSGRTSVEEIEALFDRLISSQHTQVPEQLGLSHLEWTAFGHGVGFAELADWRARGWPQVCGACGKPLDPQSFGWLARDRASDAHVLVHVSCLSEPSP